MPALERSFCGTNFCGCLLVISPWGVGDRVVMAWPFLVERCPGFYPHPTSSYCYTFTEFWTDDVVARTRGWRLCWFSCVVILWFKLGARLVCEAASWWSHSRVVGIGWPGRRHL